MQKLLKALQAQHPSLSFQRGPAFYWSPETSEIFYKESADDNKSRWALLHEVSHALLQHKNYHTDIELLQLEVAAWDHAKALASDFDLCIDDDHIQDCLDTYRDWLHGRSICPSCTTRCLQQSDVSRNVRETYAEPERTSLEKNSPPGAKLYHRHYRCHNCHTTWRVSASRFCRPYRAVKNIAQPATIFAAEL